MLLFLALLACAGSDPDPDATSETDTLGDDDVATCDAGFEAVDGACVDLDECADGTAVCDDLAGCVNEDGGYACGACPEGYADDNGDGSRCSAIDECGDGAHDCADWEICVDADPFWTCEQGPLDASVFPVTLPGGQGVGQLSLGPAGSLIAAGYQSQVIYRINYDGTVDAIEACCASPTAVVHNPADGVTYYGNADTVYAVDFASGALTPVLTGSPYIQYLAAVPEGFGAYGGWMLMLTYTGPVGVHVFDPADPANTLTQLGEDGLFGYPRAAAFGPDGDLYISETAGALYAMDAAGNLRVVDDDLWYVDGLASNPDTGVLYLAQDVYGTLLGLHVADGTLDNLGSYSFNGGTAPTGMVVDGHGNLALMTQDGNDTRIEVFPAP